MLQDIAAIYLILCNYGLQQSQSGLFYLSDGWFGISGRYGFIISFQVDLRGGSYRDTGKLGVIIGRTEFFHCAKHKHINQGTGMQ